MYTSLAGMIQKSDVTRAVSQITGKAVTPLFVQEIEDNNKDHSSALFFICLGFHRCATQTIWVYSDNVSTNIFDVCAFSLAILFDAHG